MVLEERITSEMQRLKLKYFGGQSLEISIPIHVPLIYQGMSDDEATKVEDEFCCKWRFNFILLTDEEHWAYLYTHTEVNVGASYAGIGIAAGQLCLFYVLSWNLRSGPLHLYQLFGGGSFRRRGDGSGGGRQPVVVCFCICIMFWCSKDLRYDAEFPVRECQLKGLDIRVRELENAQYFYEVCFRELVRDPVDREEMVKMIADMEIEFEDGMIDGLDLIRDKVMETGDKNRLKYEGRGNDGKAVSLKMYKTSDMDSGKDASVPKLRTDRARSNNCQQGFGKDSEGDQKSKRIAGIKSRRLLYSSVVGEGLGTTADSHSDTEGFPSKLMAYPPGSNVFREFCNAKAFPGGKWGNCVKYVGRMFRGCTIVTGEKEFPVLPISIRVWAKSSPYQFGEGDYEYDWGMSCSIERDHFYGVKNYKTSGGAYLCASGSRRRFFDLNSAGQAWNDNFRVIEEKRKKDDQEVRPSFLQDHLLLKGDFPSIQIPEAGFLIGVERYKCSLIGRLDLLKVKLAVARSEALSKWNLSGYCQFIPLGKGYFTIFLDNEADKVRIWGGGPWHIDCQLLRVNIWTPDFDINKQKNTHAMVWVKFPGLGTEYWEEDVLMSIARTVGNPVQVDNSTLCRNTVFYASVLVDVGFSETIPRIIMIEREGFEFCQEIQLGRAPMICSHYKVVSHLVSECRDVVKEIEQEKPIPVHKTYNGDVEMWDSTIRLLDGSNNSKEVDKEASLVNKSWADMIKEGDSTYQNAEGVEVEDFPECESLSSDCSSNINKGIANKDTSLQLNDLDKKHSPDQLCIAEPKMLPDEFFLNRLNLKMMVREAIHFDNGVSCPNIWVFWRKELARELWRELSIIGTLNLPWLMVGDFNVVLRGVEKKEGRGVRWNALTEFQNFVNWSCLLENHFSGSDYTWCNGQMGNNRIFCKLNRMLCNQAWSSLFLEWKYKVMPQIKSDHSPLLGWNVGIAKPLNTPFRFCNMWTSYDSFLQVVKENWDQDLDGAPLFRLGSKL
ncbi:hypothetical protein GIB67_002401 [Kingdonia uniflora]|uniref:DUF4283 domain-containing protein n=1 Tax=Kingdonia uniflora TaxID=39325 RepID=A0A7J7M8E3_9MAGN|nr:hypothetical protein GIB67_002401 [Kingdonia uniflora]